MNLILFYAIVMLGLISSCAPSRYVKPLAKGQNALQANFGGPLIKFAGTPMPVPYTSVGYGRGLTDRTTVYGDLHTTSLLFGNAHIDVGATSDVWASHDRWKWSGGGNVQCVYSIRNATGLRVWPTLETNIRYEGSGKKWYCYGGVNTWIELAGRRAHHQVQRYHVLPSSQLGGVKEGDRCNHQVEVKYMGIGLENKPGVVEYMGIGRWGAWGLYYSLTYKF